MHKGCGGLVQLILFSLDHYRRHPSVSQLLLPIVYWTQSKGVLTHTNTQDKKLLTIQGMKGIRVPLQLACSNTFLWLQLKEGYAACILKWQQHDISKRTGSCWNEVFTRRSVTERKERKTVGGGALEAAPSTAVQSI